MVAALLGLIALPDRVHAAPKQIMAYYERGSSRALIAGYPYLDQLCTDTFSVTAAGVIQGEAPAESLRFARRHGIQTFATVSNFGAADFSPAVADAILKSPTATGTFIASSLATLSASRYAGLNLDFESVPTGDRIAFSAFVTALARVLHQHAYKIIVSVPAMLRDDPNDSWTGAFDLSKLSRAADSLQYMTYDEHGPWSSPGPVAGLGWVEKSVRYAVGVAPAKKISLGLPAYGYDWNLTKKTGSQIPWNAIDRLRTATRTTLYWDKSSSSPYLIYTSAAGERHVVWYENQKSISVKAMLADKYRLAGVSVYALGMEDLAFWHAVDPRQ